MKLLITGASGFIGTNLIQFIELKQLDFLILNIDKVKPKLKDQMKYWCKCDINHLENLKQIVDEFSPDFVIHLAAEADVSFKNIEDFKTNIIGVENICKVCDNCSTIKRIIFTSTQYVHQFHGSPTHDNEFYPFTMYGASKVQGEKIVRTFNWKSEWTIVRPTNIYGPYNDIYVHGFFKVIERGYYFHPNKNVIRSYGFVGNIVEQLLNLLYVSSENANKKTYYLGDEPIHLLDFVNEFHNYFYENKVKLLPSFLFKVAARIGDLCNFVNLPFPMNTIRYTNLISPNPANMSKSFSVLGRGSFSFTESVKITLDWYIKHGKKNENTNK